MAITLNSSQYNNLWSRILDLEYATHADPFLHNPHYLAEIPNSFRKHQRNAYIDICRYLQDTKTPLDNISLYLDSLINNNEVLDHDDISLITSIYEILWSGQILEEDQEGIWLNRLQELKDLNSRDGNPLGQLGWRMIEQSKILSGFPRWQLPSSWKDTPEATWKLEEVDRIIKDIAEGWTDWFSGCNQGNKDSTECGFLRALRNREMDKGHPLFYAAVEGTNFVNRTSFEREKVHYYDELLARKHNDIALIISDAEESNLSQAKDKDKDKSPDPNRISELRQKQTLLERLSLRHWQLRGFVSIVANFTRIQVDEILTQIEGQPLRMHLNSGDVILPENDGQNTIQMDSENDQGILLNNLIFCLYTIPWGWPFRSVSQNSMKSSWQAIETALVHSYDRELVDKTFDHLMKYVREIPKAVLARHSILPMCHEFIRDERADVMLYYSRSVYESSISASSNMEMVYDYWLNSILVAKPDSEHMKQAVEVVLLTLDNRRTMSGKAELIRQVSLKAKCSDVIVILDAAIPIIRKYLEPQSQYDHVANELIQGISYGLMNRHDLQDFPNELIHSFSDTFALNQSYLSNHPGTEHVLKYLQGIVPSLTDDMYFLNDVIAHMKVVINEAETVNRRSYSVGHKTFHFRRPISRVASQQQVQDVVRQISRFSNAKEPANEEIEGIFASVGLFMSGVPNKMRLPILEALCSYGGKVRQCSNLLAPFANRLRIEELDGSWYCWNALHSIIQELDDVELELIGQTLMNRRLEDLIAHSGAISGLIGAISTGATPEHTRSWARNIIFRILFRLSLSASDTDAQKPELILSYLRYDKYYVEFDEVISGMLDWYIEVWSGRLFWQSARVAYQFGAWRKRLPSHPTLLRAEKFIRSDIRNTVAAAFEQGKREER